MKGKLLKKGDTIGVVAASEPVTQDCMEDMERAVKNVEELGVKVKYASNVFKNTTGYGETAKNKAQDINNMFKDKEVNAIFCAIRWIQL